MKNYLQTTPNDEIIKRLIAIEEKLDQLLNQKRKKTTDKFEQAVEIVSRLDKRIATQYAFQLFYPSITKSRRHAKQLVRLLVQERYLVRVQENGVDLVKKKKKC